VSVLVSVSFIIWDIYKISIDTQVSDNSQSQQPVDMNSSVTTKTLIVESQESTKNQKMLGDKPTIQKDSNNNVTGTEKIEIKLNLFQTSSVVYIEKNYIDKREIDRYKMKSTNVVWVKYQFRFKGGAVKSGWIKENNVN